ncbi:MAG: hypothetical protein SGPRY_003407 [Prymnesium sp.]
MREWVSITDPDTPDEAPRRKERGCIGLGPQEADGEEEGNGMRISNESYENVMGTDPAQTHHSVSLHEGDSRLWVIGVDTRQSMTR